MKKKTVVNEQRTSPATDMAFVHPHPEDQEQEKRINQLTEDIRQAFIRNQFAIPGDIDLRIRGMVTLLPHHAPLPETQVSPGVL